MTTVYAKLQVRRDTAANWEAANPVLAEGESGFTTDTQIEKIGDGVRAWNDLPSRPSLEQLTAAQDAAQASADAADQSKVDASDSADLSAAYASGAPPTGKSAKEYADLAEQLLGQTMDVFDHFDDRYLGAHASDPATDNDGNTLIAGTLYFNTALPGMKMYTGSSWVAAYIPGDSLGTAASRDAQTGPTDTTSLRLLQVGAFGLGQTNVGYSPLISDVDAFDTPAGAWQFTPAVTNYGSLPFTGYGQVIIKQYGNGNLEQTVWLNSGIGGKFWRVGASEVWGDWKHIIDEDDVSSNTDLSVDGAKLPTRSSVAGAIAAIPIGPKVWGRFTGDGAASLVAGRGVSVARTGAGLYTVTFSTAQSDTDYLISLMLVDSINSAFLVVRSKTVNGFSIECLTRGTSTTDAEAVEFFITRGA